MPTVATLLIVLSCLSLTVFAQTNVTVRDIDPRITYNPLCSPRDELCRGGWYSYNFSDVDKRTMTFGPAAETRFVLPSATFEFNGTAIYYYAISSAKTASVSISIDGGTASLVNLTQMYNLNNRSGIYFPVYAWSATNLDPNTEHKFYLEYAQSNPSGAGLWTGFDSLVYTPSTPTVVPTTSTPTPSVSYIPSKNTSAAGVNGKLIGGIFAGTLAILIVAFAFTYWCVRVRERRSKEPLYATPAESNWSIDQHSTHPVTTARFSAAGLSGLGPSASRPTSSVPPRSSMESAAPSAITRITTAIATIITPYRNSVSLPPPPRTFSGGIPSAPPSPHSSSFTPITPGRDPFLRLPRPLPQVPGSRSDTLSYTQGSDPSSPPSRMFLNPFSNPSSTYASSPLSRGASLGPSNIAPEARPSRSRPNSVALLVRQQQEIRELLERQRREQEAAGMDMSVLSEEVPMTPLGLSIRHSNGSLSASEPGRRSRPVSTNNSARSWPSDRKVDPDASPSSSEALPTTTAHTTPSPQLPPLPSTPPLPHFERPPRPPPPVAATPISYSNSPSSFRHTLAAALGFSPPSPNAAATETPTVHPRSNLARSHTVISSSTWRTQATAPPAYSPD
ncbi:hypothetical protein FS837_010628 [Tulasnella sp. UAMH 9824]|nr:hypothetical protein FS837_010628 [Tulasnella sp. UAMH 9824]